MNALILAAGFGTRLKPWTDYHPKALVPVDGIPMLERVIRNLENRGFVEIGVTVHHFSDQIKDFLNSQNWKAKIFVSDETELLLDTGGGLKKALELFSSDSPVLVHNVDILSDGNLGLLMQRHLMQGNDATLLVSDRESSRKLIFDKGMNLKGWHDLSKNVFRPSKPEDYLETKELAFSGIYVASKSLIEDMDRVIGTEVFPIMDYFLHPERKTAIKGLEQSGLRLLDIGKPASLTQASYMIKELKTL